MELSLGEVAYVLGSSCGVPERIAQGYSIDSRSLTRGQLFFAIRGPRFDGHEFVEQAFERGAVGAVIERNSQARFTQAWAQALVPVLDTTEALRQLALVVRRKWGRGLIAITGSTGKTTTKELVAAMLSQCLSVQKSPGNMNNVFGLPLALLGLEPTHEAGVVEFAMSGPGEIAFLARIAEPQIGVVTNVAPVHLQYFDTVDSIARAKRELIENLKAPAVAVLNRDDWRVRQFAEGFAGRVMTFGFEEGAEVRALGLRAGQGTGSQFRVRAPAFDQEFYLPLLGRHNVENALAAVATASLFNISPAHMQQALSTFQALPQRSEIITLSGDVTLINDCYNSNPLAMERMLETLAAWPGARRRFVVGGEMLELGASSPDWHRQIGRQCAKLRIDWLLAVQGDARFLLEAALEAGLPAERGRFFAAAEQAGEFCQTLLRPGDLVLVKGSRGVRLEKVTELLRSSRGNCPGGDEAASRAG